MVPKGSDEDLFGAAAANEDELEEAEVKRLREEKEKHCQMLHKGRSMQV